MGDVFDLIHGLLFIPDKRSLCDMWKNHGKVDPNCPYGEDCVCHLVFKKIPCNTLLAWFFAFCEDEILLQTSLLQVLVENSFSFEAASEEEKLRLKDEQMANECMILSRPVAGKSQPFAQYCA